MSFEVEQSNMLKILIFSIFISSIKASCPKDAFEWQTNCFFFNNVSTGFADAESDCVSLFGGHLSSIHDGFTNALLAQKGQIYFHESTVTDFWIGLTNLMFPGNWTWIDGTNLDFVEWKPGELQNATANCAVLSMADGVWRIDDCFKLKPYVCKVDKSVFETTTTSTTTTSKYPIYVNCTHGFTYFEKTHSCYGTDTLHGPLNWIQGEQLCLKSGGHLTSVHSYEELRFLESFVFLEAEAIWTGAFSNDGGKTWKWSDESSWDFNPWFPGYPNQNASACGLLAISGLEDYQCDTPWPIICKVPIKKFRSEIISSSKK